MPIGEIILNGFGLSTLKPKFYTLQDELPVGGSSNIPQQISSKLPSSLSIKKDSKSLLGTPIFSDCIIENATDQIYLDTALFTVRRPKNIVKASIIGGDTTVKEYINSDDHTIQCQGVLHTFKSGNYPISDVKTLISILETNDSIKIICPYLRLFGIFNIVIEDYEFPQRNGFENTQLYSFNAISDEPIQLIEDV